MPNQRARLLVPILLVSLAAACRSPKADAAIAEQMQQMGDELNAVRQDNALTAERVDSLRVLVARQDTLLRQLASMANVPVPPR